MTSDERLMELIRLAGQSGPEHTTDAQAVVAVARQRKRTRRAQLAAAASVVAVGAAAAGWTAAHGGNHSPSGASPGSGSASLSDPVVQMGPPCNVGFRVIPPVPNYNEERTVQARGQAGQPITIHFTLRVQTQADIARLDLLVAPKIIGVPTGGAFRTIPMFHGKAVDGVRLTATTTIPRPGRYLLMLDSVSSTPCRGYIQSGMEEGAPIGYLVVS